MPGGFDVGEAAELEIQAVQLQARLEAQEEAEYAAFIEERLRRLGDDAEVDE